MAGLKMYFKFGKTQCTKYFEKKTPEQLVII